MSMCEALRVIQSESNRGRDRQMASQCASPRSRKKAPPPGQVRWRI